MRRSIKAHIYQGDSQYVAECLDIGVVTQGATIEQAISNLREAVGLFLEGENPADYGLADNPSLLVTIELEPAAHAG